MIIRLCQRVFQISSLHFLVQQYDQSESKAVYDMTMQSIISYLITYNQVENIYSYLYSLLSSIYTQYQRDTKNKFVLVQVLFLSIFKFIPISYYKKSPLNVEYFKLLEYFSALSILSTSHYYYYSIYLPLLYLLSQSESNKESYLVYKYLFSNTIILYSMLLCYKDLFLYIDSHWNSLDSIFSLSSSRV